MIDLISAQKVFKEYLRDYDEKSKDINLKIVHTYGVMERSEYIAKELKLNEEEIQLAKLIALLHDIGRFEQARKYNTFVDKISPVPSVVLIISPTLGKFLFNSS